MTNMHSVKRKAGSRVGAQPGTRCLPKLEDAPGKRHTIVCLSSQRWADGMWTNKQHVMSRLGKHHDVLYVDFCSHDFLGWATCRLADRAANAYHPLQVYTRPRSERRDGVTVLDFFVPEELERGLPSGHFLRVYAAFDLRARLLARYLRRRGIEDAILWVYHPGYGSVVERIPRKLLVYDCVDEYAAFPEYRTDASWLIERERKLCKAADLVFTSSQPLHEAKRALNPTSTFLVHNVGDAEHFGRAMAADTEVPADIAELPRPIVGFIGAVSDYKLDVDWLMALAERHPSWSIVLVGTVVAQDPSAFVGRLGRLPNVFLLGHRSYDTLPGYAKGMNLAVIPYQTNDYTRGVFPIKFFELLATGRPVVTSNLPALAPYASLVRVATDADSFVSACEQVLADPDTNRQQRIEAARGNTWQTRVHRLMELVDGKLAG